MTAALYRQVILRRPSSRPQRHATRHCHPTCLDKIRSLTLDRRAKESLGRGNVAPGDETKVDGVFCTVSRPVEIDRPVRRGS